MKISLTSKIWVVGILFSGLIWGNAKALKCAFYLPGPFPELLKSIHNKKWGINQSDCSRMAPLFSTVANNSEKQTEILLKMGADPKITDSCGYRPIHHTSLLKNTKIYNLLLKHGDKPDIFSAVIRGDLAQVKKRIALGENPKKVMEGGGYPLLIAARLGHFEVVKYLWKLTKGAAPKLNYSKPGRCYVAGSFGIFSYQDGTPLSQAKLGEFYFRGRKLNHSKPGDRAKTIEFLSKIEGKKTNLEK